MSGDETQAMDGGTPDVLELAESIAAGRLPRSQAEATIRGRHAGDPGATEAELAELDELVATIGGVRQHALAFRHSVDERSLGPVAAGLPPADGTVDPRRVVAGDVRLRSRPTRSRWAAPGLLAAAALVVIAVIVGSNLATAPVAGSPSQSAASSGIAVASGTPGTSARAAPSPSSTQLPSIGPSIVPTPTDAPTPVRTAAPGVPAIQSAPLPGAPTIADWSLASETEVRVSAWTPDGTALAYGFSVSTWQDPDRAGGSVIDRRIVVSPDGRRVVFAETEFSPTSRARLRVLGRDGSVVWTDPSPTGTPDLVWSADGTMLVVGSQPATWKIVSFGSGTTVPKVTTRTFAGAAYRVLGFSQSGDILYGWDTTGEAEWWQTPFQVPTSGGSPTSITRFSGKTEPIAVTNGTTPTSEVTPADDSSLLQPGIDPKTYRVLDRGGASGNGSWEIRDGAKAIPLDFKTLPLPSVAWGPGGAIAAVFSNTPDRALSLQTVAETNPDTASGPVFSVPKGTYWQQFDGVRGSIALLGLAAERSGDAAFLGADELVAVDLTTASSAVFVLESAGLTGLHFAGWIAAG